MIHFYQGEDILKKTLAEFKTQKSRNRKKDTIKKLDYYSGSGTKEYIADYFKASVFQEIPFYTTNITKKFVNKLARNYTLCASRIVNKKYDILTKGKNKKLKHIEKMTKLNGTIATQVIWKDDSFDYRPVYYFDVFVDSHDPHIPQAIVYPIMNAVDDPSNTDIMPYVYWDDTWVITFSSDGKVLEEKQHGYGLLPFVFTHREDQLDSFFVEGANDIVNCNEHLNISLTELHLGLRFQMFGQPWASGIYEDQPIARVGTDTIINLPEGAKFGIESPQGNIADLIKAEKFAIELVASNNHMWVTWAEEGDRPASGISLMIRDFERMEDFKDDIELWRVYEHKYYEVEKVIAEFNNVSLPDKFSVNFNEPEYPKTSQDRIFLDNWMLERGHITDAQIMVRDNDDITEEEAQVIIDKNREINNSLLESKELASEEEKEDGK